MTDDEFWRIIADSRRDFDPGRFDGNMKLQAERLEAILAAMTVARALEFDGVFRRLYHAAYRWDLWAAAYVIEGGCSDDEFMDFRFWLISAGRAVYEAALADPESLVDVAGAPGVELTRFEEFGSIAARVLEEKGVTDADLYARVQAHPHPEEPAGERWDDDDLPRLLPKLWAKFGDDDADS